MNDVRSDLGPYY